MITGIRGLCNGLGPALYGFIFYLFNVELIDLQPVAGRPSPSTEVRARSHAHTGQVFAQSFQDDSWCPTAECLPKLSPDLNNLSLSAEVGHPGSSLPVRGVRRHTGAARRRFHPHAPPTVRHQGLLGQQVQQQLRCARSEQRRFDHAHQRRGGHRAAAAGQQHVTHSRPITRTSCF